MNQQKHLFRKRNAIAIYRVSTQSQCDSIEVQTQYVQEYCKKHPELELIKTHQLKESAYCLKPQELDEIIKNVPNGCAIIIMKVDRLTRNHKDIHFFEDKIEQNDVEFHFIEEGIIWNKDSDRDTSNKMTELAVKAEKESISTSDRTKKCNVVMRSKGKITYPAPFGYINYQEGKEKGWKPHNVESEYVKDLFGMYSTGQYSIEGVVRILNKKYEKKIEKPVTPQRAHELLKNPFFIGWARYDNNLYKHNYKTFISKDLFDICQKILSQKRPKNKAPKKLISPLYHIVKEKYSGRSFTPYEQKGHIYMKGPKGTYTKSSEEKVFAGIHNALKILSNTNNIKDMLHTRINETNIKKLEAISLKIKNTKAILDDMNERVTKLLSGETYGGSELQIERAVSSLNQRIQNETENLSNYKAQKQALLRDQVVISDNLIETFDNMCNINKHTMLETLFSDITYDDGNLIYNFRPTIRQSAVYYSPGL